MIVNNITKLKKKTLMPKGTQPSPLRLQQVFPPPPWPTTFSQNLKHKHWSRSIVMLQCKIEKRNIDVERNSTLPLDYSKF
jgi:hypothetical protein